MAIPPPPPIGDPHRVDPNYIAWAMRTYAPGVHVKWKAWANIWLPVGAHGAGTTAPIPPEARGEVVAWHSDNMGRPAYPAIRVEDSTAYMPYGPERQALEFILHGPNANRGHVVREHVVNIHRRLEALDDNWGAPRRVKTWKGRHTAPNKKKMSRNPRCPSCGGVSHPASGSVLPSGEVICGPCVRRFWAWAAEHGEKRYRVGPKGKGSKYIEFPTGIMTKKNRRTSRRRSSRR